MESTALPPLPIRRNETGTLFGEKVIDHIHSLNDQQYSKGCVYRFWVNRGQKILFCEINTFKLGGRHQYGRSYYRNGSRAINTLPSDIGSDRLKELSADLLELTSEVNSLIIQAQFAISSSQTHCITKMHFDRLAARANVAQFISFNPELEQRYARIHSYEANIICIT